MLVKVDKFVFPFEFIIMDFNFDEENLILLERPFLATRRTSIDVEREELTMRVNGKHVMFNVLNALQYPKEKFVDISMIFGWENIVHKNLLKSTNNLEQESGKLNKEVEVYGGIVSGH